jgi:hypothetical protein
LRGGWRPLSLRTPLLGVGMKIRLSPTLQRGTIMVGVNCGISSLCCEGGRVGKDNNEGAGAGFPIKLGMTGD